MVVVCVGTVQISTEGAVCVQRTGTTRFRVLIDFDRKDGETNRRTVPPVFEILQKTKQRVFYLLITPHSK